MGPDADEKPAEPSMMESMAQDDAAAIKPPAPESSSAGHEQRGGSQDAIQTAGTTTPTGKFASLATPAVRRISKEWGMDITKIQGTGKDGRVLKEDVQRHAASRDQTSSGETSTTPEPATASAPTASDQAQDRVVPLTGIAGHMFKTMTKSLSIPHFLYTDTVDFTSLNALRKRLNSKKGPSSAVSDSPNIKLSALPFIIKAISLAFTTHPTLNAHLDTRTPASPILTHKASHNFGFAVDTPQGLVVPVIHDIQHHSIRSLAIEITRLSDLARCNKLSASDLSGATFTVSNIGSIGGGAVAPVIVAPQVAIVGVGRAKAVPRFDLAGNVVCREEATLSWSADHRVVDGAAVARCADEVARLLGDVEGMVVGLR